MPFKMTCQHCNQKFESPQIDRKYCSRACYAKSKKGKEPHNKNLIEYTCEVCGKAFAKSPSAKARFCGRKCYHTWHKQHMTEHPSNPRNKVKCTCETCGKTFERCPSHIKKGEGRFCSYDCLNVWKRTIKGNEHPLKKEYPTLKCEWCGQEYQRKPSEAAKSRFCGKQCQGSWTTANTQQPTGIEIKIFNVLTELDLPFVAQKAMGVYCCDFVIKSRRLVIECDGDYWHSLPDVINRDKKKDTWLISHGYKVLRLPEHRINDDIEWCKQQILSHL